jgi:phage baseplate assembly protein W
MADVAFPYRLDRRGRTAVAGADEHIRQMLELLLFTRPGERVNRPDFGCGLLELLFGASSPEVAAAVEVTITAAVTRWLGDLIVLTGLDASADESRLNVTLTYTELATGMLGQTTLSVPQA